MDFQILAVINPYMNGQDWSVLVEQIIIHSNVAMYLPSRKWKWVAKILFIFANKRIEHATSSAKR